MHKRRNSNFALLTLGLSLGAAFLSSPDARADEIVLIVDEHGRKIFINTGDPAKPPAGWLAAGFHSKGRSYISPPEITHLVEKTANRFEIDPQLVHAIIQVESEYNPHAISRKGAMGLMQLAPETAARYGVRNPFDPKQNIEAGVGHLRYLLNLFGGDLALSLAAYNSGVNNVQRYGGVPSYTETRDYVRKIWSLYQPGSAYVPAQPNLKGSSTPAIARYVDALGVVHFTNVE